MTSFTFRQVLTGVWTDAALADLIGQVVPVTAVGIDDMRLPIGEGRYRVAGVTRITQPDLLSSPPGYTDVLIGFEPIEADTQ